MNKVFLCGNLTRDIEARTTASTVIARTGIAVTRRGNKNETDFFNLVAFGKTAETMAQYLEKGRKIIVEGQLRFSQYEDKNGDKKTSTDVIVDSFEFADSKKKDNSRGNFSGTSVPDEDTPF